MLTKERAQEILGLERALRSQKEKDAVRILTKCGEEVGFFKMFRKDIQRDLRMNERRVKTAVSFMLHNGVTLAFTAPGKASLYTLSTSVDVTEAILEEVEEEIVNEASLSLPYVFSKFTSRKIAVRNRDFTAYLHIFHNPRITVRELAIKLGVSHQGAQNSVQRLIKAALIIEKVDGSFALFWVDIAGNSGVKYYSVDKVEIDLSTSVDAEFEDFMNENIVDDFDF